MIRESDLTIEQASIRDTVLAGDYYIKIVNKGQTFRILDLEGNQAADTLFYNAENPIERYSAMDTIREQGNIYLTAGSTLMSNECNPMLEITADTCGRHDTVGGACATESNTVRYALEKKCMHACRDSWMLAVAENEEYGLSKVDITHNINFFMNVPVTPEGKLTFEDGLSDAEVDDLINNRIKAKEEKNWTLADQIRDELKDKNIILEDSSQGTTWRRG